MDSCHDRVSVMCAPVVLFLFTLAAPAQEPPVEEAILPAVTFFYYDAGGVEWAVSAEPDRFGRHLSSHADSRALFEAVSRSASESPSDNDTAAQMTRWIAAERERFDQSRREPARARMAEGIVAYLRAYDFSISKLVEDLKRRSGAAGVELVVIHLRDAQGESSYKLKVVLVDPEIEVGKQGFNVNLPSPDASYTVVTYALGVALYEVQELINRDSSDGAQPPDSIEPLPVPEPVDQPVPPAVPAG